MSYQSPIEIITSELQSKVEEEVYSAVQCIGIDVNKNELMKALQYDRGQYEKGYKDRDSEIVRCKDCQYWRNDRTATKWLPCSIMQTDKNWFCADGERCEVE